MTFGLERSRQSELEGALGLSGRDVLRHKGHEAASVGRQLD